MYESVLRTVLIGGIAAALCCTQAMAREFKLKDPKGDDKGPGNYEYPTDGVYTAGSFDVTELKIKEKGKNIQISVKLAGKIEDPWDSKAWNGNGFSIQFAQIYFDLDHKKGSGVIKSLPGTNIRFQEESAWDKVVLISPQPRSRIQTEVDLKAAEVKERVVIPKVTRAQGNTLIAVVAKESLGGALPENFGVQILMQSNEGYPAETDLLTRKVNEYNGQHRFGGGSDYDCDPHVMDILMAPAQGDVSEQTSQFDVLKKYSCDEDPAKWIQATIPMIYPNSK